jgi:hypothetical protein
VQQDKAMHDVLFQKLRDDGFRAQQEANQRFKTGDTERALEVLKEYLSIVASEPSMEPGTKGMLTRPVEARLQQFKTLKAQKDYAARRLWPSRTNRSTSRS